MITTSASANVVLFDSAAGIGTFSNDIKYFEPQIEVQAVINNNQGATLNLIPRDGNGNAMGIQSIYLSKDTLNAETMTGSGVTAQAYSLFEQAAVTYLEGIPANSGITFTIT